MNTVLSRNKAHSNLLTDMFERHVVQFGRLQDNTDIQIHTQLLLL